MIVHIPLQLTLANKLYLSSRVDIEPVFNLTKRNTFGLVLYMALKKFDPVRDPIRDSKIIMDKYDSIVNLHISETICLNKGVYLSLRDQVDFNQFIRAQMMDDFFEYMNYHYLLNKVQLRQSIMDWQRRCGLYEDAIAIRTLEKAYERHRKEREADIVNNPLRCA